MIQYVFLALFLIVSGVHLWDSWTENAKRRAYTKPFLLIFLTLFYCFAAKEISWVLVAALLTSWLGDVLLIPKGTKWFVSGGISFLVSHVLFILVYLPAIRWDAVLWWVFISVRLTLTLKGNIPKPMLAPMILYLLANSTMNLMALSQLMTLKTAGAAIAFAGAVCFFTSDCTLYLVRYHKNKDLIFKKHFTVMLTYLLGEALITVGMLLIQS